MAKKTKKTKKEARKTYRFEMTPLSLCFWSLCLLFLLSWIFVLGIFVGRGFLPGGADLLTELKGRMDKLQTAVMPREPSKTRTENREEEDPKLAFYERLSSRKNAVRMGVEPPKEAPAEKNPAGARQKGAEKNPSASNRQGITSGASFQYTVQLASLGEKVRANAVIQRLRDQGYEAYVTEAVVGGKVYYRVRCGHFLTREEAGQHARKLAKEAGFKGFVSRIE
jgi:cell division septation protein DedD